MKKSLKSMVVAGASALVLASSYPHTSLGPMHPMIEPIGYRMIDVPRGYYPFIEGKDCKLTLYGFRGENENTFDIRVNEQNTLKFATMLDEEGYFPSAKAVSVLKNIAGGEGYDFSTDVGSQNWELSYRPRHFFGTSDEMFIVSQNAGTADPNNGYKNSADVKSLTFLDGNGIFKDMAALKGDSCIASNFPQFMVRDWLRGNNWKESLVARHQHSIAQRLEVLATDTSQGKILVKY